ncbi:MAG: biotin/lipoyl-containing protein [Puniceicoccaceae bacterium]
MKKQFRITLNGKTYEVVAEVMGEEPPAAAPSTGRRSARSAGAAAVTAAPAPKPVVDAGGAVPSPLAGKVVSIDVAVGDEVQAGQQVITLEAMKMNTVVSAPAGGAVSAVHVSAGDSVEEGQALMTIE